MELCIEDIEAIEQALDRKIITPEKASKLIKSIKSLTIANAYEWAQKFYFIGSKPYNLDDRKYLKEIMQCNKRDITVEKAAQVGVSEMAIIMALYFAHKMGENVFYGFPTSHQIGEFVQGRVDPRIEESDPLNEIIQKTNNVGLKKIGNNFIYFRGTSTRKQIITVDAGFLVMDEVDEFVQKHIVTLYKRLGASVHQKVLKLSTPTYPGYGIDYEYSLTDMRKWNIQCDECGTWQVLDLFSNIEPEPTRDAGYVLEIEPYYVCSHCRKPIDNMKDGKWVATKPENNRTGYHVSKLFTNQINAEYAKQNKTDTDKSNAKSLWVTYNTTNNLQEFFNSDLGLPYNVEGGKLSKSDLMACESEYPIKYSNAYMGVDVGKRLHVVIAYREYDQERRVLIKTVKSFEELDIFMQQFDVSMCVVDALPETRKAREFAERFLGRVYLAFYNLHEKHEIAKYDADKKVVRINRSYAMEMSANKILTRRTRFMTDTCLNNNEFVKQMEAPQRVEVLDEKTGNKEYQYLEGNNPDHYYHANTYCDVAMLNQSPVSVDSVPMGTYSPGDDIEDYINDYDDSDFSGGEF